MPSIFTRLRTLLFPEESYPQLTGPAASTADAQQQPGAYEQRLLHMQDELRRTRSELRRTRAELAEYQQDFARYKRRMEQREENLRADEGIVICADLIPVLDNFLRLHYSTPPELAGQPWVRAVQNTIKELSATLKRLGVRRFGKAGELFNPEWYEAIGVEPCPGQSTGTVLQIVQPGYLRGGRIVRRAQVIVCA